MALNIGMSSFWLSQSFWIELDCPGQVPTPSAPSSHCRPILPTLPSMPSRFFDFLSKFFQLLLCVNSVFPVLSYSSGEIWSVRRPQATYLGSGSAFFQDSCNTIFLTLQSFPSIVIKAFTCRHDILDSDPVILKSLRMSLNIAFANFTLSSLWTDLVILLIWTG